MMRIYKDRKTKTDLVLLLLVVGLALTACQPEIVEVVKEVPIEVEVEAPAAVTPPIPTIPQVSVVFTQAPYNDHSHGIIGIEKGWFEEAGITIEPAPYGKIVQPDEMAPVMASGEVTIGTIYAPIWASTLDLTTKNKVFAYADLFQGHRFLVPPDSPYKTVHEFMDEGMGFEAAAKAAIQQIKGKTLAYPAEGGPKGLRDFALDYAGMTYDDFESVVLEDVKVVQAALTGEVDFSMPGGGPLIVSMLDKGFKSIISPREFLDFLPPDVDSPVLLIVGNSGWGAYEDWLAEPENHDTTLRMVGVLYRIIDFKQRQSQEAWEIQIPFLNSLAGTDFEPSAGKFLDEVIDPFFNFEEAERFFVDKDDPLYYQYSLRAVIANYQKQGILQEEKEYDPDSFIVADDFYLELLDLKNKSESAMQDAASGIASGRAAGKEMQQAEVLLTAARYWHAARNYLDASRFADAAVEWAEYK